MIIHLPALNLLYALCLSLCVINVSHAAELESELDRQIIQQLDSRHKYSNAIVLPADLDPQPGRVRHIMLQPEIGQVIIKPAEINFRQEADSFASHRRHYLAYWSLFMAMLITDALWAE